MLIVYCAGGCDPLEYRAAFELARSLRAATGVRWSVVQSDALQSDDVRGKGIAVGCVKNPQIGALARAAGLDSDLEWAGPEGYAIARLDRTGGSLLLVAGNTPSGTLHGASRAAALAGARAYLSREAAAPGGAPEAFASESTPWPAFRLAERPRFRHRGALPWFNFLSGPTAWDREDWAVYVDNLARSRANALGFHVYTGGLERYYTYVEPFIQVEAEGVLPEAELDTTRTARWGYRPLSTRLFAAGGPLLFPEDVFGSEAALPRGDLRSRYERAQELLRWVMARSREWGIKPFLGFEAGIAPPEVHSLIPAHARLPAGELDPFHPVSERIFHRTLAHIVERYPELDALWLFQHEHVVFSALPPKGRPALEAHCDRHRGAFPELPEEARWKGPWLLAWIESAWKWKERHAPHLKIAVSGWGGGGQFPKLIPGLHRTLPADVAIAALIPGQGEGTLPPELRDAAGRERIAVPWWEGDAQLWHPQPRVDSLLRQQADFAANGIDGSVGLHWRTQDIEANAWSFFESCWESRERIERPAIAHYADYAAFGLGLGSGGTEEIALPASAAGTGDAAAVAALLHRSETERWFRGVHSPEYFAYTSQWGRLSDEQREAVRGCLGELEAIRSRAGTSRGAGAPSPAFDHLVQTLRFALALDRWSQAIAEAEEALEAGSPGRAVEALCRAPVREALDALSARVMTQGDRGVLASANQRVWLTHRSLFVEAMERLGARSGNPGATPVVLEGAARPAVEARRAGAPLFDLGAAAPSRGGPQRPPAAVSLPVHTFWNLACGDRAGFRVFAARLDAAAAFLALEDESGNVRRLALEQTGPGAFARSFSCGELALADSRFLRLWVEVWPLGDSKPAVPKGGELTVALFRGAPNGAR